VKLQPRTATIVAWGLWLATFGCCAGGLLVTLALTRPLTLAVLAKGAVDALTFPLGFATVGLVVSLRRPANPIGWLYAAAGLAWAWNIPLTPWVDQLLHDQRPLPLAAQLTTVIGEFAWAPAIAASLTLPLLLLPEGRLRSRRWRVVVATAVAGPVLLLVAGSLIPGPLQETPIDNPFGLPGVAGTIAGGLASIGLALHVASVAAALVCLLLRFRSSRGVERQQLRWVAAGAAGAAGALLVGTAAALSGIMPDISGVLIYPALVAMPVAVAVAVLRYRLWDLDRLISRTVTYAVVTGLLVVPYLLIVPAATRLFQGWGSLAVAAATLAAAALFQPLRRRVQDLVDRRFNRRRYDAARTLDAFSARLREQVDLDALEAELLAVVDQTVAPAEASLWLRPPANPRLSR
jgi:hypothetical protein